MKSLSQRYAWLVIAIPIVAFMVWAAAPRPDPRIDCDDVTDNLLHEYWSNGEISQRRLVINCLLGGKWSGSELVRVEPDLTSDVEFEFDQSILVGMTQDQIVGLLGDGDYEKSGYLRYDLGVKPQSPVEKLIGIGPYLPTRSLGLEFCEETGTLESIKIEGQ